MPRTNFEELLEAGVHFGHLKRKWNPAMAPYIFMERNGIHIIDLHKTAVKIEEAASALKQIAKSGRKILFVATKKQAKDIVDEQVSVINMPYVTERWPGGMLTNFPTIRKSIKKMVVIDRMEQEGTFKNLAKRERLQILRQRAKLEKNFGSIADLTRLPAALFVVDIMKEYIAVREAKRLNIPVFAIVDTNSDPNMVDFVIPANDDASKSLALLIGIITKAIQEGLNERQFEKEKDASDKEKKSTEKREKSEPERSMGRKTVSAGGGDAESGKPDKDKKPARPRRKSQRFKSEGSVKMEAKQVARSGQELEKKAVKVDKESEVIVDQTAKESETKTDKFGTREQSVKTEKEAGAATDDVVAERETRVEKSDEKAESIVENKE